MHSKRGHELDGVVYRSSGRVERRCLTCHRDRQTAINRGKGMKPRPPVKSFFDRVDVRAEDECWEWTAERSGAGYGLLRHQENGQRITELAHRKSWEIAHGAPVPDGMVIRHHCDNPPCVNPAHLAVGTQRDNMADARERGRLTQRGRVAPTKATAEQATRAALLRDAGWNQDEIADDVGLSQSHVSRLLNGKVLWWQEATG